MPKHSLLEDRGVSEFLGLKPTKRPGPFPPLANRYFAMNIIFLPILAGSNAFQAVFVVFGSGLCCLSVAQGREVR